MATRYSLGVLMAFLVSTFAFAQDSKVEILSREEKIFVNNDCKENNSCDLKGVEYFVEDYKVGEEGDYSYGTRFFARFETKSVRKLKKYVFVQFIKGCLFSSRMTDGWVEIMYNRTYHRNDKTKAVIFKFPNWSIDSGDFDPAYSTYPGLSRFYGFRWNTVFDSFSANTEELYGKKKPKVPRLYIFDRPSQAFYLSGWAHNVSLQFRTCIYKSKDVPAKVSYDNVNFAVPINCYEWNSSFVYNHATNEFESHPEVVSACL